MLGTADVSKILLTDLTPLTPSESGATNSGITLANNDATLVSGIPTIKIKTGDWGENIHTFDAGFICTPTILNALATPATCNTKGIAKSDAKITFTSPNADRYDIVQGATYTGSATYATASLLFNGAGSKTGLPNPSAATQYTIRVFNGEDGCYKDTTVTLNPVTCTPPCGTPNCGTVNIIKI